MNDRSEYAPETGGRTPTHDQICTFDPNLCRDCRLQAEARAGEREQAAQRVSEAEHWSHIVTDDALAVLCGPDDLTVQEYAAVQRGMRIAAYVARYSLESAIDMARRDKAARGGEQA